MTLYRRARYVGRCLLAGALILSATTVTSSPSASAQEAPPPTPPPPARVLVVSDSSLAAIRWYTAAQSALLGAEFTLDLESCRRLRGTSCLGREGRKPPTALEVVNSRGAGHDTLVVFAGYNDTATGFARGFDEIVAAARAVGITRIVWTTLRVDVDYISPANYSRDGTFRSNNKVLRDRLATGAYPDVVIADWDRYSALDHHWFATDGVHFTSIGAWASADYLTRKLAFLDGRACPTPRRAGEAAPDPCPDPDPGPPDVDLVSLYPIDPAALQCYEVGEDRHIECRPDSTVRAITQTLRFAMSGPEVKALQQRLIRTGDLLSRADGMFGKATLLALQQYQMRKGLPITGVAGPATRDAMGFGCPELALAPGTACPADAEVPYLLPSLRYGSRGAPVLMLQQRLEQLGAKLGRYNGRYLARTRTAVRAVQRANGLRVTGVVDAATATVLGFIIPVTANRS